MSKAVEKIYHEADEYIRYMRLCGKEPRTLYVTRKQYKIVLNHMKRQDESVDRWGEYKGLDVVTIKG